MERFARVAVEAAIYSIDHPYDYIIPGNMSVLPGMRVVVPFGNRRCEGLVLSIADSSEIEKLKPIDRILDENPVLDASLIKLALWMHDRFYCTVYEACRVMLPSGLRYAYQEACVLKDGFDHESAAALLEKDELELLGVLIAHGGRAVRGDIEEAMDRRNISKLLKNLCSKGFCEINVTMKRRAVDKNSQCVSLAVSFEEACSYLSTRPAPTQKMILEMLAGAGRVQMEDITYYTGASPATVRAMAKKGLVVITREEMFRRPSVDVVCDADEIQLNAEQKKAFEEFSLKLGKGPSCGLLHGVTGSGKTSVYIKLIEQAIGVGGGVILLVPEISLTQRIAALFIARFGERVAILHSGLGIGERFDEWKRIKNGYANVVIGTRSAIFAPLSNLSLIILDEEHEQTYYSEVSPRYHARDVAKFRCVQHKALLLLGSATPSVESMYSARQGRYSFCQLRTRYNEMDLPRVDIVDLREEVKGGHNGVVGRLLEEEINKNLQKDEQTILFINRRGAGRQMLCADCGYVPLCVRCTLGLVYHSANGRLMCHICGYSVKLYESCPECSGRLRVIGAGTQSVVTELEEKFPGREILRMDSDVARGNYEKLLDKFKNERVPFLVGTQMISKGLDFENVTLVGVLSIDGALYADDFRAYERTFAQITQVIGRAGRGQKTGRAIVQTYNPEHSVILAARKQDYDSFYAEELLLRQARGIPPFGHVVTLNFFGLQQDDVLKACLRVRGWIDRAGYEGVTAYGPAPNRILRANLRYRYHMVLFAGEEIKLRRLVRAMLTAFPKDKQNKGVYMYALNV